MTSSRLLPWLIAAVVLLTAASAEAQLSVSNMRRTTENAHENELVMSFSDCETGNDYIFTVTGLTASTSLSVWAASGGSTCTQQDRMNSICDEIVAADTPGTTSIEALPVTSQSIVSVFDDVAGCVDSSGTVGARPVNLYFFENLSSNASASASATVEVSADLRAPNAPVINTLGVADETSLTVSFSPPSPDTDVSGYIIYCDPGPTSPFTPDFGVGDGSGGATGTGGTSGGTGGALANMHTGGAGGAGGAGVGGFGGSATGGAAAGGFGGATTTATGTTATTATTTTGAGAGGGSCASDVLRAGESYGTVNACGQTKGRASTDGTIENLVLGESYAVAVAAYDNVNNIGPISELACGAPEPVIDFFEHYRDSGGLGGGGMCNCSVIGVPSHTRWGLYLTLAGGLVAFLRRRRNA